MLGQNDIEIIRNSLKEFVGREMRVITKKGRKKKIVRHGVLIGVYPSVFTIKLHNISTWTNSPGRSVSFNYTDILTHAIEVSFYSEKDSNA